MAQSPLTTRVDLAHSSNYTVGRQGCRIGGIVIHHACATTIESVARTFQTPGRNGSAHYTVCGNQISLMVDENNTAWHCSNWWGNCRTIGIETCNSSLGGDWPIADDTMETLARLVAEIAKRYGLGKLYLNPSEDLPVLSGHKDWVGASTACPGPYLYPRLQWLCDRANEINYPPSVVWYDSPYPVMVTNKPTSLYELPSMKVVKSYPEGERIESLCQYAFVNDKAYLRTEYSKLNNKNNGFLEVDLSKYEEPAPEPEPEPEPTPEPEPEPTPTPTPDPDEKVPNWFVKFIKDLIEFLFGWLKKGKE